MDNRVIGRSVVSLSNKINRDVERTGKVSLLKSLTGTNFWIIAYLAHNSDKENYQCDIEREFSIRRATVSKVIKNLEQQGYVKKEAVLSDARLKKLTLTDKAYLLHEEICSDFSEREKRMSSGISAEDLKTFYRVIEKISRNLDRKE